MRLAYYIFSFLLIAIVIGSIAYITHADTTVMSDNFSSYTNNQTITSEATYNFAAFPGEGTGNCCGNPSTKWEMDSGDFIGETDSSGGKWGDIATVLESDGENIYRLNTQASSTDTIVSWVGKSTQVGQAADIWLRYQSQFWLYALQYDRSDGCIVAKRKIPYFPSPDNHGIYYELQPESRPPDTFNCNHFGVLWSDIFGPGNGTSTAVDDATLNSGHQYTYQGTITTLHANTGVCNVSFDCVEIKLYRGGALVMTFLDKNDGWAEATSQSEQQDCDAGLFNGQTGFQQAWCKPIYAAGKSGFRNDDFAMHTWITNFTLADASSTSPTPPPPPPPPPPPSAGVRESITLKKGTMDIHGGTVRIK